MYDLGLQGFGNVGSKFVGLAIDRLLVIGDLCPAGLC